eukprot:COSAG05_NODE_276_length_12393_cov_1737.505694_6_plen_76_part_00
MLGRCLFGSLGRSHAGLRRTASSEESRLRGKVMELEAELSAKQQEMAALDDKVIARPLPSSPCPSPTFHPPSIPY